MKIYTPFVFVLFFLLAPARYLFSQNTSQDSLQVVNEVVENIPEVTYISFSGYVDTYYSKDNDVTHMVARYPQISPKRDEFRLNIASIGAKYLKNNVRANVTLQYGDIPDIFWTSGEQLIQEANVGFSPGENFWIDAGYFLTYIGAESIKPIDNNFGSLSMISYYEPTYQTGVSFSYSKRQFAAAIHLMNGYNVLTDNNKNKSFGLSLSFKPYKNIDLIYNNQAGNESSDPDVSKFRLYNNFIFKAYFGAHWNVIFQTDYCIQQNSSLIDTTAIGSALGGFLTAKYTINPKFSLALRAEYMADFDGVLSGAYTNSLGEHTGLQCFGPTFAFEYRPISNAYVRADARYLKLLKNLQLFNNARDYRLEGSVTMGVTF